MTEEEIEFERQAREAEEKLRPQLTDEFLTTLAQAVVVCDWHCDLIESMFFAEWCFDLAKKPRPDWNMSR